MGKRRERNYTGWKGKANGEMQSYVEVQPKRSENVKDAEERNEPEIETIDSKKRTKESGQSAKEIKRERGQSAKEIKEIKKGKEREKESFKANHSPKPTSMLSVSVPERLLPNVLKRLPNPIQRHTHTHSAVQCSAAEQRNIRRKKTTVNVSQTLPLVHDTDLLSHHAVA